MIFARDVSDSLTSLVKKLEAEVAAHSKEKMGSFVTFCSDDEGLKDKLAELAKKENLKKVILTIDNAAGPPKYEIAKDADITVVMYNNRKVVSNYAFKKGEMSDKDIEKILADVPKLLSASAKPKPKKDSDK